MAYFVYKKSNNQSIIASNITLFGSPIINTIGITNLQSGDVYGNVVSNGVTYNVYALKTPNTAYTFQYSSRVATQIFVLAVAGGGAGSNWTGGGGGGGGVIMTPISMPSGSSTINVSVGAGGAGPTSNSVIGSNGSNTTVTINAISTTLTALGGGRGAGGGTTVAASTGGSGGGGSIYSSGTGIAAAGTNTGYNYANAGSNAAASPNSGGDGIAGGGGGAGIASFGRNGGTGIKCYLPGIKDFAPSGTAYGTYYWGGGGGGCTAGTGGVGGNGGIGGGGGGNYASTTYAAGLGDTNGISPGTAGAINNGSAGNGGTNTGGGGGGGWSPATGTGGAGGSGIVVIAFPQSTVAVDTTSLFTNPSLSTAVTNSIASVYACKLINYNYYGPIITLRHSADSVGANCANFVSDTAGNLYTGTGISLLTWLTTAGANTTYAFVCQWYDQGMVPTFNSAYQNTLTSQPIYDVANKVINFGYTGGGGGVGAPQTNCYLRMANGAIPYGDSSYTVIFKHWNIPTTGNNGFLNGGLNNSTSNCLCIRTNGNAYFEYWGSKNFSITSTIIPNNVISSTYVSGSSRQPFYVNSTLKATGTMASPRTQVGTSNFIGVTNTSSTNPGGEYINGQIYYMYIFNSSLSDSDRLLMEAS